ncbi:hypothetical protein KY290_017447 [Solanum tuberosum]|uniref:Reverse transcriptase zinc-binding domain-containing protein n=1 Tax=Solanum tuberosum TaxID=4113 RepID=A0ABQ7VBB6_SOLTU|nr:hypothetical protein KY290_017447 [Solanum tuberosum]
MIQIREDVEHNIWWQTKQGALYYVEEEDEDIEVKEFITEGRWSSTKLRQYISEEMMKHIVETKSPKLMETDRDKAWWMGETNGDFSVKSAWENLMRKKETRDVFKHIWNKGLPLKINFFIWRIWKGRVLTNDNLPKMRINLWYSDEPDKLKIIYRILPVVITWILWKRRNIRRHAGDLNIQGMIFQVLQITQFMIERKFHWIKLKGKDMIEILGASKHRLFHCIVKWQMPHERVIKCNTDGACKGNPDFV